MLLQWPPELDEASFLKQFWQTRPVLIKQAFANFENPLSPDELAGLATDPDIESRIILRENDIKWHCRYGPFQASELENLPARDWSLLVSDIEKHLPEMRAWLAPFTFIPQWRIDDLMISYAPTGASVGAHIDNYDVFLLQAAGRRRWSIAPNMTGNAQLIPDLEIGVLADFEAEQTFDLEPGDMLYLPPGVPHHGISLDNQCMTWSIGFRAPSHREVITDIAENIASRIPEEAFYSDPAILLHEHSGEISPNAISRMREIWNTYVHPDEKEFEQLAGHLLTRRSGGPSPAQLEAETANTHNDYSSPTHPYQSENQDDRHLTIRRVTDLLASSSVWEKNSFSQFAFITQLPDEDNTNKPGVFNKLREKVAKKVAEKSSADEQPSTDNNDPVELADNAISIDADRTVQTNSDTTQSPDERSDTAQADVIQAQLFVDGTSVVCSQQLARLLTSTYQFQSNDLRMFIRSGTLAETDAVAIEWLCAGNHLLTINMA